MRTSATLFHYSQVSKAAIPETAAAKYTFSPPANLQPQPWHSPVAYLFGGLAAMLGLIAFALLLLACSYWKLSDHVGEQDVEGDATEKGDSSSNTKASPAFEEKLLVIMAGDVKPTFLATPTSCRASSFEDEKINSEDRENEKPQIKNQTQVRTPENGELNQERIQT